MTEQHTRYIMNRYTIYIFLTLTFVSCYGTDKKFIGTSIWIDSHKQLLNMNGEVKEATIYQYDKLPADELIALHDQKRTHLTTHKFNVAGQLEYYNTSNTEPHQRTQTESIIEVEVAESAPCYYYDYDTQGRINSVSVYDINRYGSNSPFTYIIEYGDHNAYIPAPFSLGGLPIYLLKGVTSITSQTTLLDISYSLVYNGSSAESNSVNGSGTNSHQTSTITFANYYPHTTTTSTLSTPSNAEVNEVTSTKVIEYRWSDSGVLNSSSTLSTDQQGQATTEQTTYSPLYILQPTNHTWWSNGEQDGSFSYLYNDKGLVTSGISTAPTEHPQSYNYIFKPFTWIYEQYDTEDNWTVKIEPEITNTESRNINYKYRWIQSIMYY